MAVGDISFQPGYQQPPIVANPSNPWSPGALKRFPWLGLGALLGSLGALAACVGILVASDGKPIRDWSIQPSVYLAIAVPVVNLLLMFSLGEGIDIAWWRKATASGTTVSDLHRLWSYGRSLKDALLAGRHTNLVAIACVLATLAQINSPLLQRASTVIERGFSTDVSMNLTSAQSLPPTYYTGYTSGRAFKATFYTPYYSSVVMDFNTNKSLPLSKDHGCSGICNARMTGLGIAVNCSTSSMPFDLHPRMLSDGTYNATKDPAVNGTNVFYSYVNWEATGTAIEITTLYKDTHSCDGDLHQQTCTILPATVQYQVIIDGLANTIVLDPSSKVWDDRMLNSSRMPLYSNQGANSFAGYLLALLNKYNSSAHMNWSGAARYTIDLTGSLATQYAVLDTEGDPDAMKAATDCTVAFSNPMDDILAGARELMFRTSLAIPQHNATFGTAQSVRATQIQSIAVFRSNYIYLAGAVVVTLVAIIAITSIFKGYSEFGRSVSLSPIEVAKAFNAPLLKSSDSNQPVDKLIKEIGTQSLRYGVIEDSTRYPTSYINAGFKENSRFVGINEVGINEASNRKLCMADEDVVAQPREGQIYVG